MATEKEMLAAAKEYCRANLKLVISGHEVEVSISPCSFNI